VHVHPSSLLTKRWRLDRLPLVTLRQRNAAAAPAVCLGKYPTTRLTDGHGAALEARRLILIPGLGTFPRVRTYVRVDRGPAGQVSPHTNSTRGSPPTNDVPVVTVRMKPKPHSQSCVISGRHSWRQARSRGPACTNLVRVDVL